jgi:hypothetical protein
MTGTWKDAIQRASGGAVPAGRFTSFQGLSYASLPQFARIFFALWKMSFFY